MKNEEFAAFVHFSPILGGARGGPGSEEFPAAVHFSPILGGAPSRPSFQTPQATIAIAAREDAHRRTR